MTKGNILTDSDIPPALPESESSQTAVDIRQQQQKQMIIDQLRKIPVVQLMVEKTGIGRTSYYRWRKEDKEFAKACDEAMEQGCTLVNDLAESQLISAIKDKDFPAIRFWLVNHHPAYATKVQINANINNIQEQLTPEQQQVVDEALRLLSLSESNEEPKGENKNETHT
jgi:hypothetical protein